ncbi:MAG: tryptophan synthase subunit alpha [Gemmatimonadaceae bacterium]
MASASATTSPDVLTRHLADLRAGGRRALVVYVTAGHPDLERSLALLQGLDDAGADVIEVGVPFSDPMADGAVIQASSQRALELGVTLDTTLALISRARVRAPIVLFSYLNPLLAERATLLERAAEAGVHGILVTDLPVGADPQVEEWIGEGPLAFVRLVAPTTPRARMAEITRHGRGFVYLISRLGVTGERGDVPDELPGTVALLREVTALPICVGFGISGPEQAAAIGRFADGIVVGSAVVRAADRDVNAALSLVRSMRASLDDLS